MTEKHSPEHIAERLEPYKDADWVSDQNRDAFFDLIDYLKADSNISNSRIIKYCSLYKTLFQKFVDFNLVDATKKDIRRAAGGIESSTYADRSKKDLKDALKKFYRTRWEDKATRPDRIRRIIEAQFLKSGTSFEDAYDKTPLEPDEIMQMVDAAQNRRDALIPLYFFETGARVGAIQQVTLNDVTIHEKYAEVEIVSIKNDKDPRTIPLTRCFDLLVKWLEVHPRSNEPDAPLFVNIHGSNGSQRGDPMKQRNFLKTHKKLAERAGIDKRVTNHIYRHSAATYYGMFYSVQRMLYHFAWKDPSMARTYCHENEKKMKQRRLKEEGLRPATKQDDPTKRQTCDRCGETWSPTRTFCGDCKHVLGTTSTNDHHATATRNNDDEELSRAELQEQVADLQAKVARLT